MPSQDRSSQRVLVAMSGGVDSSVTALLLKDAGYDVVGCFMRNGATADPDAGADHEDDCALDSSVGEGSACGTSTGRSNKQGCCSVNDAVDARRVAAMLDIPFYVLNFEREFDRIINYFVGEYNAGRTPNPCVRCNDWLKFGKMHDYAKTIDAAYVATGHYARIDRSDPDRPRLCRGRDESKDQSYVLFGAKREDLSKMMLPIGEYEKDEVRRIAEVNRLPVFNKPDSQEICFVPDNNYARLVKLRTPADVEAGAMVDEAGVVVGEHEGHQHFTIGQRRGLGVAFGKPTYVIDKDAVTNTVTVGDKRHLLASGLVADETNWLIDTPVGEALPCRAQIRYNAQPVPATLVRAADGCRVMFDKPVSAVTPGQAVVCFEADNDAVIGGGWIRQTIRDGQAGESARE